MFRWLMGASVIGGLLAIEPVVFALDPFLITTATSTISSSLTDRITAPFYGYEPDRPDNVSLGTKNVVVLLLDDETIAQMDGVQPPLDQVEEYEFYLNILNFEPHLVVSDRLHAFDLEGLADYMTDVRETAAAAGVGFLMAGASDGGRRASSSITDNLEVSPVIHSGVDKTYQLVLEEASAQTGSSLDNVVALASAGLTQAAGPAQPEANLALQVLRRACRPGWAPAGALRGCREIGAFDQLAPGASAHIQYGSLNREAWFLSEDAATPARPPKETSAVQSEGDEDESGCRTFESDFWSRSRETFAQLLSAASPLLSTSQIDRDCPYPLTLTRHELADIANAEYADFYRAALSDKIVFIGFKSDRPLDLVPILNGRDASIYAHAMMTINLLDHGADHIKPSDDLGQPLAQWFDVQNFRNLNIQRDFMIESSVTLSLVAMYFLVMRRASRHEKKRGFNTRMFLLWYAMFGVVAILGNVVAFRLFDWPGFNWVGSLVYTEGMRLFALRLIR